MALPKEALFRTTFRSRSLRGLFVFIFYPNDTYIAGQSGTWYLVRGKRDTYGVLEQIIGYPFLAHKSIPTLIRGIVGETIRIVFNLEYFRPLTTDSSSKSAIDTC